jgi:ankyrin repeat protein
MEASGSTLFDAAHQGDLETVKRLVGEGISPDASNDSSTPLHMAVRAGNPRGSKRSAYFSSFFFSLGRAECAGHVEVAKFLLSAGANVNLPPRTVKKQSALHLATQAQDKVCALCVCALHACAELY